MCSEKCQSQMHNSSVPCIYFFFFMISFRHGKIKPVTVNTELQWDMDLTGGKHLPLAKANKTKVQRASKPVCINVTMSGKRGDQRTFVKFQSSQGGGKRLLWHVLMGASAGAQEKQQGQGETLGSSHGLDVLRVAVPVPAASFLRANQGKRN